MSLPHRLHGVSRPQVFLLGRPRDAPINDGIFPLTILGLLELSNEFVEDAGKSFCCCFKFLDGPLGSLAALADLLCDGLVYHHEGGDVVAGRADLRLELARNLYACVG